MDAKQHRSQGFTLIATLLLLLLLSGVALGLMYMVNTETRVGGNDLENGLAYHAAEGGMEKMTADLANLFSSSQAPNAGNIAALQAFPPTIPGVTYPEYTITPTNGTNPDGSFVSTTNTISSGNNKGLYAQIIPITLSVTAQRPLGDEVRMIRGVEVALIPVFQFGVFCDGDCSYFAGPAFDFAGRVHANGNLFLAGGATLTMEDQVAAAGEVIREQLANGYPTAVNYTGSVLIPNAPNGCSPPGPSCLNLGLSEGSKVAGPTSATNTASPGPNGWQTTVGNYNGYLLNGSAGAKPLTLPFVGAGVGAVQIIRRPAPGEVLGSTLSASRLFNQAQIRIQISDDPAENHNGDASKIDAQDIQLASIEDAHLLPLRPADIGSAGTAQAGIAVTGVGTSYFGEAKTATDPNFVAPLHIYGNNLYSGTGATEWPLVDGWLRVEIQKADGTWLPVTAEWLSLGFGRGTSIPNTAIGAGNTAHPKAILIFQQLAVRLNGNGSSVLSAWGANSQYNWYPINFYDPREGEVRDTSQAGCTPNGVMNAVELDVWNLRQWLNGTFGGNGALTDNAKENGYVLYFSDRRGMLPDANVVPPTKTGESGLEDVINSADPTGTPNGLLETAEDVDGNGKIDNWGGANIGDGFGVNTNVVPARPNPFLPRLACSTFARANRVSGARHVLRLINGTRGNLPTRSGYTGGFTVTSENPVYILGDYNASLADHGWNDTSHAAAAVIADAVTVLSNSWSDVNGFANPTSPGSRPGTETYYRLAVAAGKNIDFAQPTTWGAANDYGTDGGVHNFLRYIEAWGAPLHYRGSLVSLYYAQYGTGIFKCCTTVYSPPPRDYSFDKLFLIPSNLPPGTPMFRDVDNTSFRQDFRPY